MNVVNRTIGGLSGGRTADRYDALGAAKVGPRFGDEHTHTSRDGALNADMVSEALRAWPDNPLARYLRPEPLPIAAARSPEARPVPPPSSP